MLKYIIFLLLLVNVALAEGEGMPDGSPSWRFYPLGKDAQCVGMAYFALPKADFPCERALSVFNGARKHCLLTLWGTFGDSTQCLKTFLGNAKKPTLVIHFHNATCYRAGTCKTGELMPGASTAALNRALERMRPPFRRKIERRVAEIRAVVDPYAETARLILTTGLEDNYTDKARDALIGVLRGVWPYEIARNPMGVSNDATGVDLLMLHSPDAAPYSADIYVPDGFDIFNGGSRAMPNYYPLSEVLNTYRRIQRRNGILFLWDAWTQGRFGESSGSAASPRSRRLKFDTGHLRLVNKTILEFN